ncbi:hypothetical protein P4308_11915 [Bacillus wiedmannii]|uniref:hypothetical protein n=1 Tax=Bacillus wiedmannii TaxID=1890302 RepID=UPI002E20AC55|nr:hypothetical protein [Bacillus wiedmannii]
MRCYRLRGLVKLTNHRKGLKEKIKNSRAIHLGEDQRIESVREEFVEFGILDPTFEWHRNFEGWEENWIDFGGNEDEYGICIHVKGGLGSYKPEKRGWR